MAHVLKRRDQEAVRWYVLTLPTAGGGRDRISPSKGLDAELSRRERRGEALFEVRAGEYELIELNTGGKHVYTHLDNDRLSEGLHDALGRYHASGVVVEEDARLAREVLRGYASLRAETDVIRCKLYSLLLPAYRLLGESDEFDRLLSTMRSMLPVIKAGQSRALLLVTLYGCTDSSLYQRMAHELIDPWMEEASPKKSKFVLIRRLRDYDRWLKHNE